MTTHRLLTNFSVCVPESQEADYLAVTPHVVTHPDSVIGLTPKLNWMLDNLADDEGIVFLDDDLQYLCRCYGDKSDAATRKITDPATIEAILLQTWQIAVDLGVYLFGWESSEQTICYYDGLKPFDFNGYINGCAKGFRTGHGLRYDERIVAKDDYDICCKNAYLHRRLFKNTMFAFCQKDTFKGGGGLSHYRTSETEDRDVRILQAKYGDVIQVGKQGGTRKRDYAGATKVTLKLPF